MSVHVTNDANGAPRFTWTPGCRVTFVQVVNYWTLYTMSGSFGSGVTYGSVPPGTKQSIAAPPLLPGTTYTVLVGGYMSGEPGKVEDLTVSIFGSAEFTR